ncbi:glucosidase 2 subunit beta isoform X1 [Argonauta hians]
MFLVKFILFSSNFFLAASVARPRGVSVSMASVYSGKTDNFSCLDNSITVPFNYVNDDYCDCPDGSDEPGTAACINGKFHCTNAGFIPNYIPSSRVNDGFCDCCDGTDEYSEIISCPNKCIELGKKAMEERMKIHKMQLEGFATKQEFINEGKKAKEEKKTKLVELESLKLSAEQHKANLEAEKNAAEIPEKLAKETYEKAWEEEKKKLQEEKDKSVGRDAFIELDRNGDQIVSMEELKAHAEFDIDADGTVSDEEAKEYMEEVTDASHEHFMETMWPNMKDIYRKPVVDSTAEGGEEGAATTGTEQQQQQQQQQQEVTPPPVDTTPPTPPQGGGGGGGGDDEHEEGGPEEDADEETDDEEDESPQDGTDDGQSQAPPSPGSHPGVPDDEDLENEEIPDEEFYRDYEETVGLPTEQEGKKENEVKDKTPELQKPEYDQATLALIAAADLARSKYEEADKKVREIEKDISDVSKVLDLDLGSENEFYSLYGQCFEYTDREYTYSFCPYDRATQRSKSGGMETSLGHWGHWDGPAGDTYKSQKYDKGQNCWNGPDRSVKVHFSCGTKNELQGASEPSRCEYSFTFVTPASCAKPSGPPNMRRDEL